MSETKQETRDRLLDVSPELLVEFILIISCARDMLEKELDELKAIVMPIGHCWSVARETTFRPSMEIIEESDKATDKAADYFEREGE